MKITERICKGTDDSTSAASIAATYNGGGKTDWFLPSRKELDALCNEFFKGRSVGNDFSADTCIGSVNSTIVSGITNGIAWFFSPGNYWSSSESNAAGAAGAWYQTFSLGRQGNFGKNNAFYVRPVRAF